MNDDDTFQQDWYDYEDKYLDNKDLCRGCQDADAEDPDFCPKTNGRICNCCGECRQECEDNA